MILKRKNVKYRHNNTLAMRTVLLRNVNVWM